MWYTLIKLYLNNPVEKLYSSVQKIVLFFFFLFSTLPSCVLFCWSTDYEMLKVKREPLESLNLLTATKCFCTLWRKYFRNIDFVYYSPKAIENREKNVFLCVKGSALNEQLGVWLGVLICGFGEVTVQRNQAIHPYPFNHPLSLT